MTDPSAHASLVVHSVEPIWSPDARVLVLGTMPSPKSREVGIPYGHPQNRFWPVLAALFNDQDPKTPEGRRALARAHHVAIFDVLKSCSIEGASDASIRDAVPQDIPAFIAGTQIDHVVLTGSTALRFYERFLAEKVGLPYQGFPSTSPANARWKLPSSSRHTGRSSSGRKGNCARNVLRWTLTELQYWGWCLGFSSKRQPQCGVARRVL